METVVLKKNGAEAVVSTFGGELTSYRKDGIEYVWTGDPAYWSGQAPVLFPIVCSLREGRVSIGGKTYEMPQHGVARKKEWELVDWTEDTAVVAISSSPETLQQYPYEFRLIATHTLLENGFRTEYTLINMGQEPMVFCIGGHAGFRCPLEEGASFEEYKLVFSSPEEGVRRLNPDKILSLERDAGLLNGTSELPLRYDLFDQDALVLAPVHSDQVKLVHKRSGKGIAMDLSQFPAMGIWTPPGKRAPFLCLEPWMGLPAEEGESGRFEDKPYAMTLDGQNVYSIGYTVTLCEGE